MTAMKPAWDGRKTRDMWTAYDIREAIEAAPKGPLDETVTARAARVHPGINIWLKAHGKKRISARTVYRHMAFPPKLPRETRLYHPGGPDDAEDAAFLQRLPVEDIRRIEKAIRKNCGDDKELCAKALANFRSGLLTR